MKPKVFLLVCWLFAATALADDAPKSSPPKDPELRKELLDRTKIDQDARTTLVNWMKEHGTSAPQTDKEKADYAKLADEVKVIDDKNTKWLKWVVDKHGWPTNTRVGKDGAKSAWLLVQHADADPKFQRRCLDLMTKLPKDEVNQKDFAYLTDRVLLAEGKKQLYGTQFTLVDGKWKPRPLEDEANVDKRRTEVGLSSLAEYTKVIEQQYGSGTKK